MRLSKLEPHVVQPSDETADVRLFLQDLEEAGTTVSNIETNVAHRDEGNGSSDDEVKQGFVRLVDFIAKKTKNPYFGLQAVANRAYKLQHSYFENSTEKKSDVDVGKLNQAMSQAEIAPFKKIA